MRAEDRCSVCRHQVDHQDATRIEFRSVPGGYVASLHKGWGFLCPVCLEEFLPPYEAEPGCLLDPLGFCFEPEPIEDGVYSDEL